MYQPFMYWKNKQFFDSLKTIFIHVPKNGGQTIGRVLRPFANHLTAGHAPISEFVIKNKKLHYFKFGFIRNPYSRILSIYSYFKNRFKGPFAKYFYPFELKSFDHFCNFILLTNRYMEITHTRPQYTFLTYNQKIAVDFIGKFENLQIDFNNVCNIIGVPPIKLAHINKSTNKPKFSSYTREIVEHVYKKDFELFYP